MATGAIQGPSNAKTVVLGKYGNGGTDAYTSVAENMGVQYFQLDNWDELATSYSNEEIWKINEQFLNIETSSGKDIYLSHDPTRYINDGSFYSREIDYLLNSGYRFVKEGKIWHAIR